MSVYDLKFRQGHRDAQWLRFVVSINNVKYEYPGLMSYSISGNEDEQFRTDSDQDESQRFSSTGKPSAGQLSCKTRWVAHPGYRALRDVLSQDVDVSIEIHHRVPYIRRYPETGVGSGVQVAIDDVDGPTGTLTFSARGTDTSQFDSFNAAVHAPTGMICIFEDGTSPNETYHPYEITVPVASTGFNARTQAKIVPAGNNLSGTKSTAPFVICDAPYIIKADGILQSMSIDSPEQAPGTNDIVFQLNSEHDEDIDQARLKDIWNGGAGDIL